VRLQEPARTLLRGGSWVAAGAAGGRLLQAGGWFLLARMLTPADVGAVAVAAIFVNVLALLPGLGLGTTLLARDEDPRRIAPAALSAALLTGALISAAAVGLARIVGAARGAEVGAAMSVLALALAFQGAGSVAAALLDRAMSFRERAGCDFAGGAAFLLFGVGSAALGLRATAPAVGLAAAAAVSASLACAAARVAPAWRPDFAALRSTSKVCAVVLASSLLQWLFVSADVWIVDHRFGREAVGCYSVACQLALAPAAAVGLFSTRLALPALVQARASGAEIAPGFLKAARAAALLAAATSALLAVCAGPIVRALYGERFADAAGLVAPLAIYSIARVLGGLGGPALLAAGHARVALLLVLLQSLAALPAACLLPAGLGARGTALVFALATLFGGVAALFLGARALRGLPTPMRAALAAGGGGNPT
jgi:PST family polysaccharide transporter